MAKPPFPDAARAWDERFARPGLLFGSAPNRYLASRAHLFAPGQRALAVADGEGRNSVWLARQGLEVDAFDISPVGVDKARALAQQGGVQVHYQVCDCARWDWQEAVYDVVAAIFVQFADPALRASMFAGMVRTLRPGGLLILQGYTPRQLDYGTGGPGILENLYTEELLREAFAALSILDLRSYDEVLDEGAAHAGRSALVGLTARMPA